MPLGHFHLSFSNISLLDLVLSFRSCIPGRRSVRCVCSKVAFLSGVVSFTTGLAGLVDRSGFSVFLIICIVCVGIAGIFIVGVGVGLTTIIVVIVGTIRVISGLVSFSFELTALVLLMTWVFAVVTSWFRIFWSLLCGLSRHSIYLQLIWSFQTSSNSL